MVKGGLPDNMHPAVEEALDIWGIDELYPPQADSMEPIAKGENLVVAVPTAAGKSLIAYIAILNQVKRGGKALYVVPLRALASEKYNELKELSKLGLRVALSYGDYDDDDRRLESYDVVVATSEKADSLLRHRSKWLMDLKVIVSDEVHLLNDTGRGPTLEVILTRFRQLNDKAQLVCLSATIGNSDEIAGWLGAKLISSDFRPVDLKEGVLDDERIVYSDLKERAIDQVSTNALTNGIIDGIKDGTGQVLVFVNTRRSCESGAQQIAGLLPKHMDNEGLLELADISNSLGSDTRIIKRLKKSILGGAAFHHAGLANEQRSLVEKAFKERKIKVLFATPTLAAGINLPARRVIVRDWTRFESWNPRAPIPILEIKQMFGRAGRPRFDPNGEALILARKPEERDVLMERYVWGEPEEVLSKLGSRPALRMHLLSSFATNYVRDLDEMWDFIKATFYAYQNDTWKITGDIEDILDFLRDEGFLEDAEGDLSATDLGKRVARLYIDPLSAVVLKRALQSEPKELTTFSILQAISHTTDIRPLYVRGKDHDMVTEYMYAHEDELLLPIPQDQADYDWFLNSVKTAMFLMEWIGENEHGVEASEDRIESKFNLGPGDIRSKVETAVWMLYAMRELSRLLGSGMAKMVDLVSLRVEKGIRKELIELISLTGVGRVRGRKLFEAGFKDLDDLRKAGVNRLSKVEGIGKQIALSIMNQVNPEGEHILEEDGSEEIGDPRQAQLFDFS